MANLFYKREKGMTSTNFRIGVRSEGVPWQREVPWNCVALVAFYSEVG